MLVTVFPPGNQMGKRIVFESTKRLELQQMELALCLRYIQSKERTHSNFWFLHALYP